MKAGRHVGRFLPRRKHQGHRPAEDTIAEQELSGRKTFCIHAERHAVVRKKGLPCIQPINVPHRQRLRRDAIADGIGNVNQPKRVEVEALAKHTPGITGGRTKRERTILREVTTGKPGPPPRGPQGDGASWIQVQRRIHQTLSTVDCGVVRNRIDAHHIDGQGQAVALDLTDRSAGWNANRIEIKRQIDLTIALVKIRTAVDPKQGSGDSIPRSGIEGIHPPVGRNGG